MSNVQAESSQTARDNKRIGVSDSDRQTRPPQLTGSIPISTRPIDISSTSTSSSASYFRKQSLFGTDDRIILDIGSRVTKVGFSGEARPRAIFYTLDGVYEDGHDILEGLLWTSDMFRCRNDHHRVLVATQLRARLATILRNIFYRRLMVDPKQRKIFLIESALMPLFVKETLLDVLFGNLQIPTACFIPSHLASCISIARLNSLVLDIGYQEATILPICYGRSLMHSHLLTTPRAGKRLARRLRTLLMNFAEFTPPFPSLARRKHTFKEGSTTKLLNIPKDYLSWKFLDEVISKALLVADEAPASQMSSTTSAPNLLSTSTDEEDDADHLKALKEHYKVSAKAKDMVIIVPNCPTFSGAPLTQPTTIGSSSDSSSPNKGSIIIPGWIRERTAEVLFEEGDEDEMNLMELVLQTLIKLPVELRIPMARSIYLVGGVAMLPGLAHRLRTELVKRLELCGVDDEKQIIALSSTRVGSLTISQSSKGRSRQRREDGYNSSIKEEIEDMAHSNLQVEQTTKMKHRDQDRFGPISRLSHEIALLNDHAPRVLDEGISLGGNAPSFSANLSSWIGASLMGSLRVETLHQKSREEWDKDKLDLSDAKKNKEEEVTMRPGLGLGRGSFLGTVNGLDLGTYGPLSAGARGTFTSPKNTTPPRSSKVA